MAAAVPLVSVVDRLSCPTQEEVHAGYVQAKRKYEDAMRANQQLSQDNQELQAKYAQKAM